MFTYRSHGQLFIYFWSYSVFKCAFLHFKHNNMIIFCHSTQNILCAVSDLLYLATDLFITCHLFFFFFFFFLYTMSLFLYTILILSRLKGLEQVTKATMLGHLLPVLLTSLMHPNLQTLSLADALMPQLVQLVLYTSQVSVCVLYWCFVVVYKQKVRIVQSVRHFFALNRPKSLSWFLCSIRPHCS